MDLESAVGQILRNNRGSRRGDSLPVFDYYGPEDYKFVAIDETNDQVVYGHSTSKSGVTVDAVVAKPIEAGVDYNVDISLKGLTVSVEIEGQIVTGFAYNAVVVDGAIGLFANKDDATFSSVVIET
ncbi:hypothetical protein OAH36_03485, partial [Verrucomicrobia bacterium]|nr:hypothetical protein [Verrucomicrobiota bacterium]